MKEATNQQRFFRSVAGLLFLSLISCGSVITRLDPVEETMHLVLYAVPAEDYPEPKKIGMQLPPVEAFPEITEEQMNSLLRSFRYEESLLWGKSVNPVFYEEEIRYITPFILKQLRRLPENHRLVVVSRHDPDKSVLSRMDRVTLVLWNDEAGINFLFGEIRHPIPLNDPFVEDNWKDIAAINPVRSFPDYRLMQPDETGDFFTYKEIKGRDHYTWAVVDRSGLENLTDRFPSPEKAAEAARIAKEEAEKGSQPVPPAVPEKSLADKLRELQEAYDAKLISESEYETKRKAVIDNH